MNIETREGMLEGWQDETETRSRSVKSFLKRRFATKDDQRPRYDHFTELHFSGDNSTVMSKLTKGEGNISKIDTLYEHGEPAKVHVAYDSEGQGHTIDVYFQGTALADLLREEASQPEKE